MKKLKPLKKFVMNKGATIILVLLTVALGIAYSCTFYQSSKLSIEVSNLNSDSESRDTLIEEYNNLQTWSEISLVVFSVAASALLSSILIERKNSNKIVEQIFVDDFFTSEKFLELLNEEDKKKVIVELEKQCGFDGCRQKSEMYLAVKEKLNRPIKKNENLFYEKYHIDIGCEIKGDYIEKTIVRSVKIKALDKRLDIKDYVLLSISSKKINGHKASEITQLKIDDKLIDLKYVKQKNQKASNIIDEKRGYSENIEFYYDQKLNFSNKTAISIEMEYVTRCPINDLLYTVRMPYPCQNFTFIFNVKNEDYVVNPSAFGFIDDGNASPNRKNDRKTISINFNDWIFPLDGVCVYLEKNVAL